MGAVRVAVKLNSRRPAILVGQVEPPCITRPARGSTNRELVSAWRERGSTHPRNAQTLARARGDGFWPSSGEKRAVCGVALYNHAK